MIRCESCGNTEFAYKKQNTKSNVFTIGLLGTSISMWIPIIGWIVLPLFLIMMLVSPFVKNKYYSRCLKCHSIKFGISKEEAEQFKQK